AGSCCEPPSQTVTPILRGAVCIAAGKIWRLTCWLCIKTNYLFICPGLKNAAGKVTQGMTRPLLRHSKKQPKSARRRQKRNPEEGVLKHEDQIISQGLVRSGLVQGQKAVRKWRCRRAAPMPAVRRPSGSPSDGQCPQPL